MDKETRKDWENLIRDIEQDDVRTYPKYATDSNIILAADAYIKRLEEENEELIESGKWLGLEIAKLRDELRRRAGKEGGDEKNMG